MSEKDTAVRKSDEQVEVDRSSLSCPQTSPGFFKKLVQVYAQYIVGKGELIILFTGYIFLFLIPAYYTITTKIPLDKDIIKTEGLLFYKTVPGKGYYIGLHTDNGDMLFTCKAPIVNDNMCRIKVEVKNRIEGQYATVHWYRQKKYLNSYQNRLISLKIGNEVIKSKSNTETNIYNAKKITVIISIIGFFFIAALNAISKKIFKNVYKRSN